MKKEALNQIQHLINISELMDQKGFRKESAKAMYDAFKIAESETYRIASEINNMTKTASRNVGQSKMDELEKSFIATAAIGSSWLPRAGRWIVDWLKGRAPGLKNLGTKIKGKIAEEASDEAKEQSAKSLRGRLGTSVERAADDLADMRFWRNKGKIQNKINTIDKQIADTTDNSLKIKLMNEKNLLTKELDKMEGLPEGLTDLGKLTAGTAAVGAAGIGGAAALGRRKRPVGEEQPLGAIDSSAPGSPGYGSSAPSVGSSGMKGFGPATSPSGANVMTAPPNIMDIEQRINNLERVVEAIRAKVGV